MTIFDEYFRALGFGLCCLAVIWVAAHVWFWTVGLVFKLLEKVAKRLNR